MLFASGGILCALGFLLLALGIAWGITLSVSSFGPGSAYLSPLVPWGIVLIGFGVMLGFFGAAVKGPSVEWREIVPDSEESGAIGSRPEGFRYACPGCGGDVYSGQSVCPACGRSLRGARVS